MFFRNRHVKPGCDLEVGSDEEGLCPLPKKDEGKDHGKLGGWRVWFARLGIVFKLICVGLGLLGLFLISGAIYSNSISIDPCEVLKETKFNIENSGTARILPNGTIFEAHVPKIIHQQWKVDGDIPERYQKYHSSWHKYFPETEYQHMFWSDESALKLIEQHYSWFLPIYNGYEFNIQRADAARYFILHHFGGIYGDLDYEPLVNFWDYIPKDKIGLVESPYHYNEYVQNSFMSSPVGDPTWEKVFDELVVKKDKPVLQSTGPVLLDTALIGKYDDQYEYLPCELYHRIPLGETDKSPWATLFHRELLGRYFPMKSCGDYHNPTCQLGLHHNTATYVSETGILKLLI